MALYPIEELYDWTPHTFSANLGIQDTYKVLVRNLGLLYYQAESATCGDLHYYVQSYQGTNIIHPDSVIQALDPEKFVVNDDYATYGIFLKASGVDDILETQWTFSGYLAPSTWKKSCNFAGCYDGGKLTDKISTITFTANSVSAPGAYNFGTYLLGTLKPEYTVDDVVAVLNGDCGTPPPRPPHPTFSNNLIGFNYPENSDNPTKFRNWSMPPMKTRRVFQNYSLPFVRGIKK